MTGPEAKLKAQVKAYLKSLGAYQFWPVQTGYGAATVDCLACIKGRWVAIETKAPGKLPTPRQSVTMSEMHKAGGIAFATDSIERCRSYITDHVLGEYDPDVA